MITREQAAANLKKARAVAGSVLNGEILSILSIMADGPAKVALQAAADQYAESVKEAHDKHEQQTGVRHECQ